MNFLLQVMEFYQVEVKLELHLCNFSFMLRIDMWFCHNLKSIKVKVPLFSALQQL